MVHAVAMRLIKVITVMMTIIITLAWTVQSQNVRIIIQSNERPKHAQKITPSVIMKDTCAVQFKMLTIAVQSGVRIVG